MALHAFLYLDFGTLCGLNLAEHGNPLPEVATEHCTYSTTRKPNEHTTRQEERELSTVSNHHVLALPTYSHPIGRKNSQERTSA